MRTKNVAVPGTATEDKRRLEDYRILIADACNNSVRKAGFGGVRVVTCDYNHSEHRLDLLGLVEIRVDAPAPWWDDEVETPDEVFISAVVEGLTAFVKSHSKAESYVARGYPWMSEGHRAEKIDEVTRRCGWAKAILAACKATALTVAMREEE